MHRLAQVLSLFLALIFSVTGMLLILSDDIASSQKSIAAPSDSVATRVTTIPDPVPESSHYLMLDADARTAYDALNQGIVEGLQRFTITVPSVDGLADALHAIVSDHPEYFWLTGACTYREILSKEIEIELEYNIDPKDIARTQAAIDSAVASFTNSLSDDASDYDKVKAAYEWIIANTDYGYESEQHQNIQSVFCDHVSVCAGYAKAFQYLLASVDVSCMYVRGTIADGLTDHAWNLVWIDGVPTYVDVTWGDPTYATVTGEKTTGNLSYDYLCVTSDEMKRTGHRVSVTEPNVICSSDAFDYYRLNGLLFTDYDKAAIDRAFEAAFDAGATQVSFKFTNDAAYETACSALDDTSLLDGTFIVRAAELQGAEDTIRYQSATSDALRIITVLW